MSAVFPEFFFINLILQFINMKGSVSMNITMEFNTMVPEHIRFSRSHDFSPGSGFNSVIDHLLLQNPAMGDLV